MNKITIIGYGKMAKAIVGALKNDFNFEIAGRSEYKIKAFIKDNELVNADCSANNEIDCLDKTIILAIKPAALSDFTFKNKAKVVYSIMAGVEIERIKNAIEAESYCRAMPNIASTIKKGISVIYAQNTELEKRANSIFSLLGKCIFVDKEEFINPATALSGSGPAYLGLIAEALIEAGVREGIDYITARECVRGLFSGFSALLENMDANEIKINTTSPNGTTAEALSVLEKCAVKSAFLEAIHSAHKKAKDI